MRLCWPAVLMLASLAAPAEAAPVGTEGIVAVLPFTDEASEIDAVLKSTLEESIRSIAGDALGAKGFTILTSENTLQVLADNGVEKTRLCDATCHLDAARQMKARLFISGSMVKAEGSYIAFVRLFESTRGVQLASAQLEGDTVRSLRQAFQAKADQFFTRAIEMDTGSREAAIAPPPPAATDRPTPNLDAKPVAATNAVPVAALTPGPQRKNIVPGLVTTIAGGLALVAGVVVIAVNQDKARLAHYDLPTNGKTPQDVADGINVGLGIGEALAGVGVAAVGGGITWMVLR